MLLSVLLSYSNFYPRSPCGERRNADCNYRNVNRYFYPRSPCGERHAHPIGILVCIVFLSTLSLRRATLEKASKTSKVIFLSTLSLRRATFGFSYFYIIKITFLSTLSLRRATWQRGSRITYVEISIHALLAESDIPNSGTFRSTHISIHALLAESDELNSSCISSIKNFYPRSPCGERPRKPSIHV